MPQKVFSYKDFTTFHYLYTCRSSRSKLEAGFMELQNGKKKFVLGTVLGLIEVWNTGTIYVLLRGGGDVSLK